MVGVLVGTVPATVATTGAPVSKVGGSEHEQAGIRIGIPRLTCGYRRIVGFGHPIPFHAAQDRRRPEPVDAGVARSAISGSTW
jgi:hypothetical protein